MFGLKFACLAAILLFVSQQGQTHPWCLNNDSPDMPEPPLTICKAYNKYPGSCCNAKTERDEVWYPRGRLVVSNDARSRSCRKLVSKLLCAPCNPLAAHIFDGENETARAWPSLCMPFCRRFYAACSDVEFNTNARIFAPLRIPGLTKGLGIVKINSLYPTSDGFCSAFGSVDPSSCHTDNYGETIGPGPGPGRVVKLRREFERIDLTRVDIHSTRYRHHITDVDFIQGSSNRVAVSFQTGQIVTFPNDPRATSFQLLLDISDRVFYREASELGLMGVAFDPKFDEIGYFYVKYTTPSRVLGTNSIVVARFKKSTGSWTADPNTERVFWNLPRPGSQHHSGAPVFGDDGLMYVPIGDGINCCLGILEDHPSRKLNTLIGKMLRVDVRESASKDNDDSGPLYTVPSSNPFVNVAGARPEIFATGVRNPFRISWDTKMKEFWFGDVGERRYEEVNVLRSGKDYGWNAYEGDRCYRRDCEDLVDRQTYLRPVFSYPHPNSCPRPGCLSGSTVIGGEWYYRDQVRALTDKYIYSDWTNGFFFVMTVPDRSKPLENVQVARLVPNFSPASPGPFNCAAMAKDLDGELHVANWQSPHLFKIVEEASSRESTAAAEHEGAEVDATHWRNAPDDTDEFKDEDDDGDQQ